MNKVHPILLGLSNLMTLDLPAVTVLLYLVDCGLLGYTFRNACLLVTVK
jgi:hypothetical protein